MQMHYIVISVVGVITLDSFLACRARVVHMWFYYLFVKEGIYRKPPPKTPFA